MAHPKVFMIVACTIDGGIAYNDEIPWFIPADLRKFKEITTKCISPLKQNAIIMGRNTWESIGRRLPHRLNVVITKDYNYAIKGSTEGVIIAHSMTAALAYCCQPHIENIFIIGGTALYNKFLQTENYLKMLDCIYLSVVFHDDTNPVNKFIDIESIFKNFIMIKDPAYQKEAKERQFASFICFPKK
jgi:dihydrofolate reductase